METGYTGKTKKIRWKKHRTAESLALKFWAFGRVRPKLSTKIGVGGDGFERTMTVSEFAKQIVVQKKWAFCNTQKKEVHYWEDGKRSPQELAFMLGHELGHLCGKPIKNWKEELRADEYGWVTSEVLRKLKAIGGRG